jgi:ribonuclease HI
MAKKFVYAVAVGYKPGVYATWAEAKKHVEGFQGARYKKFESVREAEDFIKGKGSVILGQFGVKMETTSVEPIIPGSFHDTLIITPITSSGTSPKSPHATDTIVVFTDGSALNNGRKNAKAGYAAVFPNHPHLHTAAPLTGPNPTNNRAEYQALITALDIIDRDIDPSKTRRVVIYTDSKLLIQSVTQWMKGWKRNGWKKADGAPVLNRDLLEALDAHMAVRRVEMHHVRAHTGRDDWKSRWNDLADRMARDAASQA